MRFRKKMRSSFFSLGIRFNRKGRKENTAQRTQRIFLFVLMCVTAEVTKKYSVEEDVVFARDLFLNRKENIPPPILLKQGSVKAVVIFAKRTSVQFFLCVLAPLR